MMSPQQGSVGDTLAVSVCSTETGSVFAVIPEA